MPRRRRAAWHPLRRRRGRRRDRREERLVKIGDKTFGPQHFISLDGATGEVMEGSVPTVEAELTGPFAQIMKWADKYRTLKVRTNGDTPTDAKTARGFGAEGIGLCRTEHMFFDPQRIHHMREMILATDVEARKAALAKLLPYQREDFVGIFREMNGLPVTDPPARSRRCTSSSRTTTRTGELRRSLNMSLDAGEDARRASSTKPTRCSATAAIGWRSPTPRSSRCRSAPSSKAACICKEGEGESPPRDHDPRSPARRRSSTSARSTRSRPPIRS
jgi:hypothetical protein